jgi:hypothetical protein
MQRAWRRPVGHYERNIRESWLKAIFYANVLPPAESSGFTLAPVSAYVGATNSFDPEGLVATFANDALVNDQLRDHWGKPGTRERAGPTSSAQTWQWTWRTWSNTAETSFVTANVSRKFGMAGLPELLVYAPFTFRLMAIGLSSWSFSATDTTFESGRSAVAGALGHQPPRHFAAGARNAPISQKTLQFFKSTSRRGSLCL